MVRVNTAQIALVVFTYLVAIWIGWAGQLLRENGLAATRRELRQAYRDYDELLTVLHCSPVVQEEVRASAVIRPRQAAHLNIVRGGEGA